MSNKTNSDIFFKTDHILPHVGSNNKTSQDNKYVKNQLDLINKNKQLLPPNVIYPNMSVNPQEPNLTTFDNSFAKYYIGQMAYENMTRFCFSDNNIKEFNFMRSVYPQKLWWKPENESDSA